MIGGVVHVAKSKCNYIIYFNVIFNLAGGHGIIPIMWKRYWCVVKDSKLYMYKTSFDIVADYLLYVNDYSVENTTEKKKM